MSKQDATERTLRRRVCGTASSFSIYFMISVTDANLLTHSEM